MKIVVGDEIKSKRENNAFTVFKDDAVEMWHLSDYDRGHLMNALFIVAFGKTPAEFDRDEFSRDEWMVFARMSRRIHKFRKKYEETTIANDSPRRERNG